MVWLLRGEKGWKFQARRKKKEEKESGGGEEEEAHGCEGQVGERREKEKWQLRRKEQRKEKKKVGPTI